MNEVEDASNGETQHKIIKTGSSNIGLTSDDSDVWLNNNSSSKITQIHINDRQLFFRLILTTETFQHFETQEHQNQLLVHTV